MTISPALQIPYSTTRTSHRGWSSFDGVDRQLVLHLTTGVHKFTRRRDGDHKCDRSILSQQLPPPPSCETTRRTSDHVSNKYSVGANDTQIFILVFRIATSWFPNTIQVTERGGGITRNDATYRRVFRTTINANVTAISLFIHL